MVDDRTDRATIYFNTREHVFLVANMARVGRYGQREIGMPVRIAEDAFSSSIAKALLASLDSFSTNAYSPETARRSSDEEFRAFRKKHQCIFVERLASGDLVLRPGHHEQGGWTAKRGEQVTVCAADVPRAVPSAILETLRLAT